MYRVHVNIKHKSTVRNRYTTSYFIVTWINICVHLTCSIHYIIVPMEVDWTFLDIISLLSHSSEWRLSSSFRFWTESNDCLTALEKPTDFIISTDTISIVTFSVRYSTSLWRQNVQQFISAFILLKIRLVWSKRSSKAINTASIRVWYDILLMTHRDSYYLHYKWVSSAVFILRT